MKQVQERVHDAASETATWAPACLASPRDVTEKNDHCVKPSAPQRRVSPDRRGEGGSSLKLLHQTREGHTTNLLWKLATERSPGHPGAGERKRTRVLLKQRQAALPAGQGLEHTSTCRLSMSGCSTLCPPSSCSSPGARSGTKPFPQQRRVRNVSGQAQTLQG